jgi:NAD(P)-dependent dehydrogenase (short-subunit alcohol dehydrogenase family)
MRLLVTGGTGVIGRAALPLLVTAGHDVVAPGSHELDLFDAAAVNEAVAGADAVIHLATRIPPPGSPREAWRENDRLRAEASRLLVDGALAAGAELYVQASITFMELESMLAAEAQTARFAAAGRRGVVLRFGLLDGPGTGNDEPNPLYGSTLHVDDAGRALLDALTLPSGTYVFSRERP